MTGWLASDRMRLTVVLAAMRYRKGRLAVACLAIVLGSALPATLVGLRAARDGFERELAVHGANLLIVAGHGAALDDSVLPPLERMVADGRLAAYTPRLAVVATVEGRRVAVIGTRFSSDRRLHRSRAIDGRWPEHVTSALIGANVASKLGRRPGERLAVVTTIGSQTFVVAGLVRTGDVEDDQIFVDLDAARSLSGRPGAITFVHARAGRVDDVLPLSHALHEAIPNAEVRTPLQAVRTTQVVLDRLERLVGLVTVLVLVAAVLTVFSTMAAGAMERRHEVGVMKALGASERYVGGLVCLEAVAVGLLGGLLGFAVGLSLTELIAWQVFGTIVRPSALAALASAVVGVGVSLAGGLGAVHRLVRLAPAAVLRGE